MTRPTPHPASNSTARKRNLALVPCCDAAAAVARVEAAEHVMRWTYDDGRVSAEAVCNMPPGSDCRLTSVSCECEQWGEIQRRDDGTIWHHILDYGDSIEPVWHEVKPQDDCNICLFINESGCAEELTARGTEFVIADTPIRPVWQFDGCDWEPTDTTLRAALDGAAGGAA